VTVAKRDLVAKETLDAFGGYTFRGVIYDATDPGTHSNFGSTPLPAGLAPGARVVRPVSAGGIVTCDDVELDESAPVVRLRRAQYSRLEGVQQ